MQPLADGLRNANFKLQLDSTPEPIVLRVYEHDFSICRKEVDLIRLVGGSVPVPVVIHAEPRGSEDTLNEKIRGGGHIGSNTWFGFHASWPLACLSVAPDSLTISMWPVIYRFDRSSIRCLVTKRLRLGRELTVRPALLIVHTNPAFPKSVAFQPRQFPLLLSLLAQNGYLVTEEEANLSTTEPIRFSNVIPAITYIVVTVALIAAVIAIGIAAGFIGRK